MNEVNIKQLDIDLSNNIQWLQKVFPVVGNALAQQKQLSTLMIAFTIQKVDEVEMETFERTDFVEMLQRDLEERMAEDRMNLDERLEADDYASLVSEIDSYQKNFSNILLERLIELAQRVVVLEKKHAQ